MSKRSPEREKAHLMKKIRKLQHRIESLPDSDQEDLKAVSWNYMETGHGKGAPGGIGAVAKGTADKIVRFGREIGTLKDIWLIMKEKIKNVEVRIISKKDIEKKKTPRDLKSFKDENTTPEVIEEINNSPNKYFTKLNSFVDVQYSSPVTPKLSSAPKVKILSDVRLDWSNTSFNMKTPSYKQQRFQTDFEKIIASSEIPASSGSSELVFKTKKQTEDVHINKENEVESDSDDEYNIFDYKKTVKGKIIANKRLEKRTNRNKNT
ncbi:hypothetical protein ACJJTC_016469 [Scirpophaga incertulas]